MHRDVYTVCYVLWELVMKIRIKNLYLLLPRHKSRHFYDKLLSLKLLNSVNLLFDKF